jgi:hypothetical protein
MKTRRLLIGSLTVNVLLLGIGIYLVQLEVGDLSFAPPLLICVDHGRPNSIENAVASTAPRTNVLRRANLIRLESEDYAQYVARLRSIGCPEKTVCDIVTADVNDMFHRRSAKDVYTVTRFAP